jgi:hypothetical protein
VTFGEGHSLTSNIGNRSGQMATRQNSLKRREFAKFAKNQRYNMLIVNGL